MNPHKSAFGLGNYDINVIMSALHSKQCEAIWFDRRKYCTLLALILKFIYSNIKVIYVLLL